MKIKFYTKKEKTPSQKREELREKIHKPNFSVQAKYEDFKDFSYSLSFKDKFLSFFNNRKYKLK